MEAVIDQFPLPKELVPRVQWSTKNYRFTSTDEKRELSLCRSSMALVFTDYVRWEEFAHTLERPTTVLFAHYKPSFITRIGLRYIDVFKKSVLGFDKDYPWNRLLKAHVIGPLASVDVCDNIEAMDCTYEIKLKDSLGTARVKLLTVLDAETQEKCLMLDSDFYIHGNFPEAGIRSELDILHSKAHRLMRWCITDELHKALVPEVAP
jgi:uncharacterized protein (TIGR04255 family)